MLQTIKNEKKFVLSKTKKISTFLQLKETQLNSSEKFSSQSNKKTLEDKWEENWKSKNASSLRTFLSFEILIYLSFSQSYLFEDSVLFVLFIISYSRPMYSRIIIIFMITLSVYDNHMVEC